MNLKTRIIVAILFASTIGLIIQIFTSSMELKKQGEKDLISKSSAILSRLEKARDFVAAQGGLEEIIKTIKTQFPDGKLSDEAKSKVLKQVPIYASLKIGSEDAEKEGYEFRVFSEFPRKEKNKATAEELTILKRFESDTNLNQIVENKNDKIYVYRPVRLLKALGCLTCHGAPSTSPWGNGTDVLGHKMEDWNDNYLHAVFTIIQSKEEINQQAKSAMILIVLIGLGGIMISLTVGFLLTRNTIEDLKNVNSELNSVGTELYNASQEISNSSQSLSVAATEAAASIEETSASTEEVSSMIRLNANNSEQAKSLAEECQNRAQEGKKHVEDLINSMDEISQSSKKIEEIITVIDDIAFQTNLLALNAAVEAARAGEQGKGFAVVADAVRSLAQRSSVSAKEISALIKESVEKIGSGYNIAKESGDSLNRIVTAVEKVTTLNVEIANASNEQSQGMSSINKSVLELDKLTQQNAASAEETAASSDLLNSKAKQLHEQMNILKEIIEGKFQHQLKNKNTQSESHL